MGTAVKSVNSPKRNPIRNRKTCDILVGVTSVIDASSARTRTYNHCNKARPHLGTCQAGSKGESLRDEAGAPKSPEATG